MTFLVVAALGGLAGLATWCAHPPTRLPVDGPSGRPDDPVRPRSGGLRDRGRRWGWAAAAAAGAWVFVGGPAGPVAAMAAGAVTAVVVGRSEPAAARRRRRQVSADLPHLVGLLGAAVRAGLAPDDGLALVCRALPGPAADALARLPPRISLGVDPAAVWSALETEAALAPLGRALARSVRTGEPVADALDRLGVELAETARAETEDLARRVGVRAAVPLGICLLPAFLLLGIVPVVAGLASTLLR